ncbi:MAG: Asp-tRNA(Asn)/Glu-tRNA(Gln) amidotransferase subunit GatB [Anaerolineales bacterium]
MYEPVIGLEVHAELLTQSKMFCACPVLDVTEAQPNRAVCPVCAGMPGVLPVVNQQAVEYALRVALALECEILPVSIFARKNYFYPDLPKGYQISQYEQPLAVNGRLTIQTSQGEKVVRIRRVHLEEDTGKLTHIGDENGGHSLVDLNRAGIPLLEIVTEPDLHSAEETRAYAQALRALLRYLGVNSGDMQKGVMRIEPNLSLHPIGSQTFGTKVEIKNLNSFRALERAVAYEIERQTAILAAGGRVVQETVGWDDVEQVTFSQRSKEEAHDYRYFPEPDLPPLVVTDDWIARVRAALPELPAQKIARFQKTYALSAYDAEVLAAEQAVADYFEAVVAAAPQITPKIAANWVMGELFGLLNQHGSGVESNPVSASNLGELLTLIAEGVINQNTAKSVLAEMFSSSKTADQIVTARGLRQISDASQLAGLIADVLAQNPQQVADYHNGKEALFNWLFGQAMRAAKGKANPEVLRAELQKQLHGE